MKWSEGKTATVASAARRRIQCAGKSTPAPVPRFRRLKEHPWSQRAGEFGVDVCGVIPSAHDDRPLRRDHPCHTVQRLSEQGVWSHQRDKLFRAFMPEEPLDQRPKPHAVPPGEDDGPGATVVKAARGDPR